MIQQTLHYILDIGNNCTKVYDDAMYKSPLSTPVIYGPHIPFENMGMDVADPSTEMDVSESKDIYR